MDKQLNALFLVLTRVLTVLTVIVLAFIIYFTVREALPMFDKVVVSDFLLGQKRMPTAYAGGPSFGIFSFMAITLYISLVAVVLAVTVGLGTATYLSCVAAERMREVLHPSADFLAGTPPVMCGFVGLALMVKLFIRIGVHTGFCVLMAGILLAVMLLPSLISSCNETMPKVEERYQSAADALGISRWHMTAATVLPGSWRNILLSVTLAIGRAMGEIMAVMMAIGNADLFPPLLRRSGSTASVVALEVGTAVVGDTHYHVLYAAGLTLMLLLFLINSGITLLHGKLE